MDHKFPKIGDGCIGCSTCVSVCPRNVIVMNGSTAKVDKPEECIGCNACVQNCPVNIINLVDG